MEEIGKKNRSSRTPQQPKWTAKLLGTEVLLNQDVKVKFDIREVGGGLVKDETVEVRINGVNLGTSPKTDTAGLLELVIPKAQ
ncbi:MAG: hypothetical protein R3B41_01635 [Candidatus Doudnabacteria bacterium]